MMNYKIHKQVSWQNYKVIQGNIVLHYHYTFSPNLFYQRPLKIFKRFNKIGFETWYHYVAQVS